MAVVTVSVITDDGRAHGFTATAWKIDSAGHLVVTADEGGIVASFAATKWVSVYKNEATAEPGV